MPKSQSNTFANIIRTVMLPELPKAIPHPKKPFQHSKPSIAVKTAFVALSLTLVFYLGYYLYQRQVTLRETQKTQAQVIKSQETNQGLPVRLKIPTLNVDTPIENVGLTPKGEMAVPDDILDVGWFNLGPRPGQMGSAVIAGHLNGKDGEAGVFAHLAELKEGDKLYIEDNQGISIAFIVQKSHTYHPGYVDDVFSRNDGAYLNLVTCDGVWSSAKKSYTQRLVVFASKAN